MSSPEQPVPAPEPPLASAAEAAIEVQAPAPPPRDPVWSGFDLVLLVGAGLLGTALAAIGMGLLLGLVGAIRKASPDPDLVAIGVAAQTLAYLFLLIFMRYLVEIRHRTRFWEGVKWKWPPGGSALGFLMGGVALALGVQLAQSFLPLPESTPIQELLKEPAHAWLLTAFGILVAPFVEEMFFRGFLYPVLARRLPLPAAVLLTALAFTFIHGPQLANHWSPLLLLFTVSLAFTVARALTGSVAVPFLMHVGYNTTLFAVLFYGTDGFQHMEKAFH